jgi:hypothetical protein
MKNVKIKLFAFLIVKIVIYYYILEFNLKKYKKNF